MRAMREKNRGCGMTAADLCSLEGHAGDQRIQNKGENSPTHGGELTNMLVGRGPGSTRREGKRGDIYLAVGWVDSLVLEASRNPRSRKMLVDGKICGGGTTKRGTLDRLEVQRGSKSSRR